MRIEWNDRASEFRPQGRSGGTGRRDGLKNRCPVRGVPVRTRPSAPSEYSRGRCGSGQPRRIEGLPSGVTVAQEPLKLLV